MNENLLLKFTFDANYFYLNSIKKEDTENLNKSNYNWGEMSWFIVKLLKPNKGETVR